jgi:hypothetical protein
MSDHKVGTREPALANAVFDLPTQFESLLDTIWRCERIWALEDRIAASAPERDGAASASEPKVRSFGMNHYLEEPAWERLKDIQREMENSRLLAQGALPTLLSYVGRLWRFVSGRMANKSAIEDRVKTVVDQAGSRAAW